MTPFISAITPASRGAKELSNLVRDFKNQTFRGFEHIIVYDGEPPEEVKELMTRAPENTIFTTIDKDQGNMSIAPGTRPRNHGISMARGEYVVFCDDDDRYKDTYLEKLAEGLGDNIINVVQMSCSEARMFRDGDPTRIRLVPEVGLPGFPLICHVGTPCFIVKRSWALEEPWQEEPEHDYRFIKRICDRFNPRIRLISGMQVDVDGLVIKEMKDWVSIPPFFRGD